MRAMIVGVLLALGLTGCEAVSDATSSVRERMAARDQPQVKTYAADPRATYEAVKAAAADMGYRFVRGGAAQGQYEAINRVGTGETIGSARQLSMKVGNPLLANVYTATFQRIGHDRRGRWNIGGFVPTGC